MQILTEAEFNRQLGNPSAGYLFFGDEDYTKLHAIARLREAVCPDPAAAAFDDIRFTALDFTASRLLDALEPPPMLGERKNSFLVLACREAQEQPRIHLPAQGNDIPVPVNTFFFIEAAFKRV